MERWTIPKAYVSLTFDVLLWILKADNLELTQVYFSQ